MDVPWYLLDTLAKTDGNQAFIGQCPYILIRMSHRPHSFANCETSIHIPILVDEVDKDGKK
jgi:hypothetical protein